MKLHEMTTWQWLLYDSNMILCVRVTFKFKILFLNVFKLNFKKFIIKLKYFLIYLI